ncbi:MAG: hypothetical protein ACK41C_15450 [Phenylobacterium sp.]|jgi:hypothetical protein|uniref:hypothetical protein n=1 Tax=Phenylobacterium sp. TaxID=1871053 RepID=UPI00391A6086
MKHPFSLASRHSPDLARVLAYWKSLLRGSAEIPFWDDARLSDLPDLADRLFLIDVFRKPERFRFGVVGERVGGKDLSGLFLDDVDLPPPHAFLRGQCSVTVECSKPTFYRREGAGGYERLVLPMWGEGHVSMLLGAVDVE